MAVQTVPASAVKRRPKKAVAPKGPVYVARKTLKLNGRTIKPGTVVPEASSWPRVESWVRSGYLDIKEA